MRIKSVGVADIGIYKSCTGLVEGGGGAEAGSSHDPGVERPTSHALQYNVTI